MGRRQAPSQGRGVLLVTEGHDVFVLGVLPSHELLDCLLVIERGVVGGFMKTLDVLLLETNAVLVRLQSLLSVTPGLEVGGLLFFAGQFNVAKDDVTSIPGLGIKHIEGVPLVLHADVHQLGVLLVEDSLVAVVNPESVCGPELHVLLEEGEVLLVASAQDDGV